MSIQAPETGPLTAPVAVGALANDPQTGQVVGAPGVITGTPDTIGTVGSGFQPVPQLLPAPYLVNPTSTQPAPPPPKPKKQGGLLGFVEHVGHDAMGALNWGVGDVQHLYRYFHDVVVQHGWAAGLGELAIAAGIGVGAGLATGGVADAALAGILGGEAAEAGVVGAAAATAARFGASKATKYAVGKLALAGAGTLEARMRYADSWKNTADGASYKDPHTGKPVSFGRDLGALVAGLTGVSAAKSISGVGDAVFDFSMTPAYNVGKAAQGVRAGEFGAKLASGTGIASITSARAARLARSKAYTGVSTDDLTARALLDVAAQSPRVQQMASWIAKKPGETDTQMISRVTTALPYFDRFDHTLMKRLAGATSGEEVLATVARAINNSAASFRRYGVPTMTLTRKVLGNPALTRSTVAEKLMGNSLTTRAVETTSADGFGPKQVFTKAGHIGNLVTSYTPWTLDSKTGEMSGMNFDPMSADAPRLVRSILRHSMTPQDARDITARYHLADERERRTIYTNAVLNAFRADGVPEKSELFQRFQNMLEDSDGDLGTYMGDGFGGAVRVPDTETGAPRSQALLHNQQGKLLIPDFNEWRTTVVDGTKGGLARATNHGDQWLYDHITTRAFKRLVLLSFGFASRVSASELIPAALHLTPKHLANSLGTQFMGRWGSWGDWLAKVPTDETDPLIGLRVRQRAGSPRSPLGTITESKTVGGGRSVTVKLPTGETEQHRLSDLTVYHRDITDQQVQQAAIDLGIKIDREHVPHIRAAVGHAMFGLTKGLVDPDFTRRALFSVLKHDGWRVPEGETADHSYLAGSDHSGYGGVQPPHKAVQEQLERISADPATHVLPWNKEVGLGRKFTSNIAAADAYHPMHWQMALKEANKDVGMRILANTFTDARDAGATIPQAWRAAVAADTKHLASFSPQAKSIRESLRGYDPANPNRLSRARMRGLVGLAIGHDSHTIDEDLIRRFGNQDIPTLDELAHTPIADRPVVKGRTLEPLRGSMPTKVSQIDKLWSPIHRYINFMSREPIFVALTTDEYKTFKPLVEAGRMSEDEAHNLSETRAMYRMIPLVHNTMLRSQIHEMTRNVWPFFFAQEQAYKRWGNAFFSNPAAMTRGALIMHGFMGGLGSVETANNGNAYVTMPGVGHLGLLATKAFGMLGVSPEGGIPSTMLGDLISLKSVFPEGTAGGDSGTLGAGPSVSPVLAVPLREMANLWNPAKPLVSKGIGKIAMQSPLEDEMIPNATLRRAWDAVGAEQTNAWVTTYNYTIQYNAYKSLQLMGQAEKYDRRAGQVDANGVPYALSDLDPRAAALMRRAAAYFPLPTADEAERKAALGRMKMQTRVLLLMKATVGAFSPLSPTLQAGDYGLRTEVQNFVAKYGLQDGLQRFLDKNPYATPYTVFESASGAGTNVPATASALKWIEQNRAWVEKHPHAAAMLLPQKAGAFDPTAYQDELQIGLRQRRLPPQFMDAIYQAEGDREYVPSLNDYEQSRQSTAGNYTLGHQAAEQWAAYVGNLANRNPVWYKNQQSGQSWANARQAYADLSEAVAKGTAPKSPMTTAFKELEGSYKTYLNYSRYIQEVGSLGASAGMTMSQLNNSFNAWVDEYVTKNPDAYPLAYSVFRRLVNEAPA